jgi:hypothetical protein
MRASHRLALNPHLVDLGDSIHQVVAATVVFRKRVVEAKESEDWKGKALVGAAALHKLRRNCKYVLYGLDEPLRTLCRMPDWIATYKDVPKTNVEEPLEEMRKLAGDIDDAIRWSYRRGASSWTAPALAAATSRQAHQRSLGRALRERRCSGLAVVDSGVARSPTFIGGYAPRPGTQLRQGSDAPRKRAFADHAGHHMHAHSHIAEYRS